MSRKTIYRNKCFFRYILYFLAELFGRILIFFNPHFNIANIRQGYVIRKSNQLNFSSSFRSVGHRVSFSTYLLTLCLEGLILIAGIAAAAVVAVVLGSIGYGISKIASYEDYTLFVLIFAAPAGLIATLYVLVTLLIFSPTAYIIANNDGVSAGETIGACYRSMINNGKMTVFLSYFVSSLLKSLYLGAMGVGGYFVLTMFIPENYFIITLVGWAVVSVAGYLAFAPILTLANRVVKEHLFEDIVLDPVTAARINEKVNLSVCNGKKVNVETLSQDLASLFDYTEDPYKILETTSKKEERFVTEPPRNKKQAVKNDAVKEDEGVKNKEKPPKKKVKSQTAAEFKPTTSQPVVESKSAETQPAVKTEQTEPQPAVKTEAAEARAAAQPQPEVESQPKIEQESPQPSAMPNVNSKPSVQPAGQQMN